ncbi:hypothetical protein [Aquimarina algiphila]|uniref:hypothetical protein n=1 Tax=Aquimarina algiphila TaxID=2047982 RepID=UPI00232F06B7|nr:hypothetical protein [Aquimarina algiphila]
MTAIIIIEEKTFTREELVKAQMKINDDLFNIPKDYRGILLNTKRAEIQIDNLLKEIKQ